MGLKVSFGTQGDLTQSWVDATLANKMKAQFGTTAAQFINVNDRPMSGALQDLVVNGVNTGDWYRDDAPTGQFATTYLVDKRWGIATSRGEDGILVYDLNAGWNGVKNISIRSDVADQVVVDGIVAFDADYSAVTSGVNSFTSLGVKRGNYLGGAAADIVTIETLTNVNKNTLKVGGLLNFNIATGGGADNVTIRQFDFNGDYTAGDSTYDKGWFGFDLADASGANHVSYVDLGAGNDVFNDASLARDNVWGGTGNDVIDTGEGADYLNGGAGRDNLTGGLGADTFAFTEAGFATGTGTGSFADVVNDFSRAEGDKLQFATSIYADSAAVLAAAFQQGADTIIDQGGDGIDRIILRNVQLSTLTASDFLFI